MVGQRDTANLGGLDPLAQSVMESFPFGGPRLRAVGPGGGALVGADVPAFPRHLDLAHGRGHPPPDDHYVAGGELGDLRSVRR
jgi:hypothetical protein